MMDLYNMASSSFLAVSTLFLLYEVAKIVYSINLHPLAKFPGPKVAAISRWSVTFEAFSSALEFLILIQAFRYEAYYEVYESGRFFYKQTEKNA